MSSAPTEENSEVQELTEAQLMAMSIEQLEAYSATISTSIGLEQSTITTYENTKAEYDLFIGQGESSIKGIDTEIDNNTTLLNTAIAKENTLTKELDDLESTITLYSLSINEQDTIISNTDSTISGLTIESRTLESELEKSNLAFISSAIYYSSLYIVYLANESIYQKRLEDISTTSASLFQAEILESTLYYKYQYSSIIVTTLNNEISTLYGQSNRIDAELKNLINIEYTASNNLNSTNSGLVTLSSLYETSLINQKYYQLVSTQASKIEQYTAVLSTFNTADSAYRANPTNTTLQTARNMAQNQLGTITVEKNNITTQVTSLQKLVDDATNNSYETLLMQYQADIDLEDSNISTFKRYRSQAESSITGYSTLYENAILDVTSSINGIKLISTFYESSLIGAATLRISSENDYSTIAAKNKEITAFDILINNYTNDYNNYISSYNGYSTLSSIMKSKYETAVQDLIKISSFYESTNTSVQTFSRELTSVNSSIASYDIIIRRESTTVLKENTNIKDYNIQIKYALNNQENALFQYYETYARQKRMDLQRLYDAQVIEAVQITSTINGNAKMAAGNQVSIIPKAVDLTAPNLTDTLVKINTINTFIDNFSNIYSLYNTQANKYLDISTVIGKMKTINSNLISTQNNLILYPNDVQINSTFNIIHLDIQTLSTLYTQNLDNIRTINQQISEKRYTFLSSYTKIFRADEIFAQESTISSFIIQGFNTPLLSGTTTGTLVSGPTASRAITT